MWVSTPTPHTPHHAYRPEPDQTCASSAKELRFFDNLFTTATSKTDLKTSFMQFLKKCTPSRKKNLIFEDCNPGWGWGEGMERVTLTSYLLHLLVTVLQYTEMENCNWNQFYTPKSTKQSYEPRHEKTCFCHMRTTKAQISLRIRAGCTGWSAPLLFAASRL